MSKVRQDTFIVKQDKLTDDIYDMWIHSEEISDDARAGQFISVFSRDGSRLLGRPLSICQIDKDKHDIRIVYRIAGDGTHEFSLYGAGDDITIMGPLGNGFPDIERERKVLIVGGGIGIPPMLELAAELDCDKTTAVLGYRDVLFLNDEFAQYTDVVISTEDGSSGTKGTVLDAIKENDLRADVIMACGPMPMLKALKEYALQQGTECYLSLEEKMACGIGACLGCVCETTDTDEHSNVHNRRVCKDGPVFNAKEVIL